MNNLVTLVLVILLVLSIAANAYFAISFNRLQADSQQLKAVQSVLREYKARNDELQGHIITLDDYVDQWNSALLFNTTSRNKNLLSGIYSDYQEEYDQFEENVNEYIGFLDENNDVLLNYHIIYLVQVDKQEAEKLDTTYKKNLDVFNAYLGSLR